MKGDTKEIQHFFQSFLICTIFSMSFSTCVSLSHKSKIESFKYQVYSYVRNVKEDAFFLAKSKNTGVSTRLDDKLYNSISSEFYTYALASKFIEDGYSICGVFNEQKCAYDFSFLESKCKVYDSNQSISQGLLPIKTSESLTINNYTTRYGYLSKSNDAIYIPESMATQFVNSFGFDNLSDLIYYEDGGYKSNIEFFIQNKNSKSMIAKCKIRGVYSDNGSSLSDSFFNIASFASPIAICSNDLIDTIDKTKIDLLCQFKYTKGIGNVHCDTVMQLLEKIISSKDALISFKYCGDEMINKFSNYESLQLYAYKRYFVAISITIGLSLLSIIVFAFKKGIKINRYLMSLSYVLGMVLSSTILGKLSKQVVIKSSIALINPTGILVWVIVFSSLFILSLLLVGTNKTPNIFKHTIFNKFKDKNYYAIQI